MFSICSRSFSLKFFCCQEGVEFLDTGINKGEVYIEGGNSNSIVISI